MGLALFFVLLRLRQSYLGRFVSYGRISHRRGVLGKQSK